MQVCWTQEKACLGSFVSASWDHVEHYHDSVRWRCNLFMQMIGIYFDNWSNEDIWIKPLPWTRHRNGHVLVLLCVLFLLLGIFMKLWITLNCSQINFPCPSAQLHLINVCTNSVKTGQNRKETELNFHILTLQ